MQTRATDTRRLFGEGKKNHLYIFLGGAGGKRDISASGVCLHQVSRARRAWLRQKRRLFGGATAQKVLLQAQLLAPATTRTLNRTQHTTEQARTKMPVQDMQASHAFRIVREAVPTQGVL